MSAGKPPHPLPPKKAEIKRERIKSSLISKRPFTINVKRRILIQLQDVKELIQLQRSTWTALVHTETEGQTLYSGSGTPVFETGSACGAGSTVLCSWEELFSHGGLFFFFFFLVMFKWCFRLLVSYTEWRRRRRETYMKIMIRWWRRRFDGTYWFVTLGIIWWFEVDICLDGFLVYRFKWFRFFDFISIDGVLIEEGRAFEWITGEYIGDILFWDFFNAE